MAKIHSSTLPNGLPIYRVDLPGTRAVTVLVAFEAGARTERGGGNGMAHFLEHLGFKGGGKDGDYPEVNETAERMAPCSTPTPHTTSWPSTSLVARRWWERRSTC